MKLNAHIKNNIVTVICYLFVLLFVYAAVSKFLDFENFQVQLGQSPLLSAFAGWVSISVIIIELITALLLVFNKTRLLGLYIAFSLMVMFTTYIYIILNYSSYIPCSCGGALEKMSWSEHFIFNIIFVLLSWIAILFLSVNIRKTLLKCLSLFVLSNIIIVVLYSYSERTIHSENPFIRRFIQGSAYKIGETELINNTQYFAGSDGDNIYFGDNLAPLHITVYDKTLQNKKRFKIQLEREDFPFLSVQVRVYYPYFYLMDGTVPVIYKGHISDWQGKLLMHSNNYYFSKAEVTRPNTIVFRANELETLENILGTFNFRDSLSVNYFPEILQKQIDGIFDTDGMLHFDSHSDKTVYIYYYRNQFMVTDQDLQLHYRGNTIDTTTRAKLKIAHIKETGTKKIASPPFIVNRLSAVSDNLLFVNSTLIGKYEPKEMWKEASVIDVYDIQENTYLSSIYIYNVNQKKVQSIFVVGDNLYAIIGNALHRYQLSEHFIKQ